MTDEIVVTKRYATVEQAIYVDYLKTIRKNYEGNVIPEESIGKDGKGIEVIYHIEAIPEPQSEPSDLEARVDDPANRTSFV